MSELNKKILSDITVYMKYAKYIPELNRRETWEELVTRNKEMHQKRYPELYNAIEENYRFVYKKKVLPSMRSLQFSGKPIEISPNRLYNCSYLPIDHTDSFIIECKGRANESFPIRWKMFKKYVKANLKHVTLYKPQNQKECDEVINLILSK